MSVWVVQRCEREGEKENTRYVIKILLGRDVMRQGPRFIGMSPRKIIMWMIWWESYRLWPKKIRSTFLSGASGLLG